MFAQWWRDVKVLSTFILQRFPTRTVAASKSHHCANTNVGCHFSMKTHLMIIGLLTNICCATNQRDENVDYSQIVGNWYYVTNDQYEEEYISRTHYQFMLTSAGLISEIPYKLSSDTVFAELSGSWIPVSRIVTLTTDSMVVEIIPVKPFARKQVTRHVRKMKRLKPKELGFYEFPNDSLRQSRIGKEYSRRYFEYYREARHLTQHEFDSLKQAGAF